MCIRDRGQIVREVERAAAGQAQIWGVHRAGGDILEPHHVLHVIRQAAGRVDAATPPPHVEGHRRPPAVAGEMAE